MLPRLVQNPALRYELSFEMGQVHTHPSLQFGLDSRADASRGFEPPFEGYQLAQPVLQEGQKCHRKAELCEMMDLR